MAEEVVEVVDVEVDVAVASVEEERGGGGGFRGGGRGGGGGGRGFRGGGGGFRGIYTELIHLYSGRRGDLMVSALDSGLGGPGSSPGQGTALCSWARCFTLIVPLSTQVYKWVLANLLLGLTLRWTGIPLRGE